MSNPIWDSGYAAGYQRALEDDLKEIKRFADMGKSAQDCAELLEYLLSKNVDSLDRRVG
jgi:hypothetical protein